MRSGNDPDRSVQPVAKPARDVDLFLDAAKAVGPVRTGGARLVFALDATGSRQATWDVACGVQSAMFEAAGQVGNLAVQLVYYRGFAECRASRWVGDARELARLMGGIACASGETQIGRVLDHVEGEAARSRLRAFVFVGDACEEGLDGLAARAGRLGLLGVRALMFREGSDPVAASAFDTIARLTGGASLGFDRRAPAELAGFLRAAAAYAGGGGAELARLARTDEGARNLLAAMDRTGRT